MFSQAKTFNVTALEGKHDRSTRKRNDFEATPSSQMQPRRIPVLGLSWLAKKMKILRLRNFERENRKCLVEAPF